MKTLHYRRHSLRDGMYIGEKGLVLALNEGRKVARSGHVINDVDGSREGTIIFSRLFHGPLIRTAQTALAFCAGLGYTPVVMPVIDEIGTDELMNQIGTSDFKAEFEANGKNALAATRKVHGNDLTKKWLELSLEGVGKMLGQMEDGETAIAFGHSPIIDLAAWVVINDANGIKLAEMEGFIFVHADFALYDDKVLGNGGKISITQPELAKS